MNRNPSDTEQELIAIELTEFARDIIEHIGKPWNDGPKAVAALLNGRLTNLKHSYAEEARRAQPRSAEAGDDFRWPVICHRHGAIHNHEASNLRVIPFRMRKP